MDAPRPSIFTRLGSISSASGDAASPAESRDDAKRNFLKAMRPLPTQHYWDIYLDRQQKEDESEEYTAALDKLGTQIETVQDFWRYHNNTPLDSLKTRESLYLFKQGFKPIWEDRRNINGGSWTFRVPKSVGHEVWTRVQLLAIGEKLESVLDDGDQLCGVGLSIRFNAHLITVWHRESDKKKSIDALLEAVLEELPEEMRPKEDAYYYKRHSDHAGFKAPPALQAVLDSQKRNAEREAEKTEL